MRQHEKVKFGSEFHEIFRRINKNQKTHQFSDKKTHELEHIKSRFGRSSCRKSVEKIALLSRNQ